MKKIALIILSILTGAPLLPAQNYFTTTWKIEDPVGPVPPSIHIATDPGYTYDYDVDLDGDGQFDFLGVKGDFQHDFATQGTYTISIRGDFPAIRFDLAVNSDQLLSVDQWGDIQWASMANAFYGCSNLEIPATDAPDLSKVTDMSGMFAYCTSFNQNINHWDVSNVRDMRIMFYEASAFNQNLGGWDVSQVREMDHMLAATALSPGNYDSLLLAWSGLPLQSNVSFSTGATPYCAGEDFRQVIIDNFSWTITDGGRDCPSDHFVTTWNTKFSDVDDRPIINISILDTEAYNYDVDWNGDGIFDTTGVTGSIFHDYGTHGTYTIRIRGLFPAFHINDFEGPKLLSVDQWGTNRWTSMARAFLGGKNMTINATDKPDLSNVEDMSSMFADCSSFNHDVGDWDVSHVKNMNGMFYGCSSFNQDISNWNVSNVKDMGGMFHRCTRFNQPLNAWQVDSVESMVAMFLEATSFDQNLNDWNVSQVKYMGIMFTGAGLSTPHYDSLLLGWSALELQPNVEFSAGNSHYCAGEDSRQSIIDTFGWTISDGGKDCLSDHFVTTWNTENPGPGNQSTIIISTMGTASYNYDVDWNNDGVFDTLGVTEQFIYDFDTPGIYTIRIRGAFPAISMRNQIDPHKLISVDQWGAVPWTRMNGAFSGCDSLRIKAIDKPDLSQVENMSAMFAGCSSFNHDVGDWDVSNVKYMAGLFSGCSSFNQDISNWDVSRVISMSGLFAECTRFNQPLNTWKVDNVVYMDGMFAGTISFNQPLDKWNTGSLEGDEAIPMMFKGASSFNQDISGWDLSKVTNLDGMFEGAASFDQNLGNWDVSQVQSMNNMFTGAGLSTPHYDSLLIGWSALELQPNVIFSAGSSTYCAGEDARQAIIDTFGWTIEDGGLDCTTGLSPEPVVKLLHVSPNPTAGPVRLDLEELGQVRFFRAIDGNGRQVPAPVEKQGAIWTFDLSDLPAGLFYLQVTGDEGSAVARVIKQ